MAQPPQPLLKYPTSTPNPLAGIAVLPNNDHASFIPRKEFIKDHRVASSFSLLALSGTGFVRLYSFSATIVSALRRLFDQKSLITGVREHAPKHFFEFALDGKPWSRAKSITSEKLIIDILTVIFHYGYVFLSTVDYGREQDDRLAIAFSKPVIPPSPANALIHHPSASAISLNQPSRTPFAISFSSATLLRVVGPPLHSTPAVLQAVRGAWPRGVVSEKKVGDSTFEFKLKGYKWFQEDTFATDSLHHILGLLSALDSHGFSLLTSITLSNRSRVKDLWIFTSLSDDQPNSLSSTPTTSHLELRREITPQATVIPGPSPLSGNGEKRISSRQLPVLPPLGYMDTTPTSSPTKQSAPPFAKLNMLRKPSPKTQVPVAFVPEYPAPPADAPYPTVTTRMSAMATLPMTRAPAATDMVRSLSDPSSVGSVDMTGIGTVYDSPSTPDVYYSTNGRRNGTPVQARYSFQSKAAPEPPHAALVESPRTKRASLDSRMAAVEQRQSHRPSVTRSSTLPLISTNFSSTNAPQIQVHAPSPVVARREGDFLGNGDSPSRGLHEDKDSPNSGKAQSPDAPRTPTPPLLTPGTFRDSVLSSMTGRLTQEIPIAWTGRDPEPAKRERPREQQHSYFEAHQPQLQPHTDAESRPEVVLREDSRTDVGYKMFPPTIREQPSKEGDELNMSSPARRTHRTEPPRQMQEREREWDRTRAQGRGDAQLNEAAPVGSSRGRSSKTSNGTATVARSPEERSKPGRRETAMSGWVMVNVESSTPVSEKPNGDHAGGHQKSSSHSPPVTRPEPARHRRSHSESRLLGPSTSRTPPAGNAPAASSMSAAAKSIAMIDAIEAREEKASSPSGLRRIFQRTIAKVSNDSHSNSPPGTWSRKTPEQGTPRDRGVNEDDRMRVSERDRAVKPRGVPVAARPSDKRLSID